MRDMQNNTMGSFQSVAAKEELLARVVECFPYPIQVYALDGTSVLVNQAMLAECHASSPDVVVGKYNIFKDPYIVASRQIPVLKRALRGETVFFPDVRVPLEEIAERYGIQDFDVEAVYQDVTVFPILDDQKRVIYIAAFLINRRVYRGKDEIEKAKEYIENHWLDRFDLNETSKAACLSKAHFTKLFRKHTGVTPHQYYTNYKISRLKKMVLDTNLSIAQAFAACNMDYNGHSARVFKEKAGLSASAYRKMSGQKGGQSKKDHVESTQRSLGKSFQPLFKEQELLAKVIEFFPYPIQIFSLDGTVRIISKATLKMIGIKSVESHVGKYNVFEDPIVRELGFMDQVRQVLSGKTAHLTDFNAPYQDMIRYFDVEGRDVQTISSDITCFPLVGADGAVEYFAAVFIIKKIYRGKEEIGWGKQYIETHWQEPFDAGETAKAACLSKTHFAKLFKKHTGITPYEYYIDCKISRLKEKLLDTNLSIAQAFAACNMSYSGHSARVFKDRTGVSPSAYRKMSE